jgi:alcohol dehydrogenase
MRAMVLHRHGGLEELAYEPNWPDPEPGPADVVLRVGACALNYHDVFTRKGMPGIKVPLPVILGNDAAGTIVETGSEVEEFRVGDRVLVDPIDRVRGGLMGEMFNGGLAEYLRVPAHMLVPLDPEVPFADAAALPVAYGTAYRMMVSRGGIAAGEKVLILGASGGVGTCCVQLAHQAGAVVIACASSDEKLERLRDIGADIGINYATADWVAECHRRFGKPRVSRQEEAGVDVVVNFTGGDTWTKSLRVLRRDGRLLTCGATAGFDPKEDIRYIWTFELNIVGSNGWSRDDLHALLGMMKTNRLTPVLHPRRFALSESRDAMRLLDERAVYGKIIVEPQTV